MAGQVVCFSVTGGAIGCVLGMLIFVGFVRPPDPAPPISPTENHDDPRPPAP
jgi:hypothetical protein